MKKNKTSQILAINIACLFSIVSLIGLGFSSWQIVSDVDISDINFVMANVVSLSNVVWFEMENDSPKYIPLLISEDGTSFVENNNKSNYGKFTSYICVSTKYVKNNYQSINSVNIIATLTTETTITDPNFVLFSDSIQTYENTYVSYFRDDIQVIESPSTENFSKQTSGCTFSYEFEVNNSMANEDYFEVGLNFIFNSTGMSESDFSSGITDFLEDNSLKVNVEVELL